MIMGVCEQRQDSLWKRELNNLPFCGFNVNAGRCGLFTFSLGAIGRLCSLFVALSACLLHA